MDISYIKTKLKKPTKNRLIQIKKREEIKKLVHAEMKKITNQSKK